MCRIKSAPEGLTRRNFVAGAAAAAVAGSTGLVNIAHAAVAQSGETISSSC